MPYGIVGIEANEPAEQQVVVQMLDQHPLRADAIDRLKQQGQQQLLGRNRGATALGVELAGGGVQPIQTLVGQMPRLPQGMTGRDAGFCGDLREQETNAFLVAAHPLYANEPFSRGWLAFSADFYGCGTEIHPQRQRA